MLSIPTHCPCCESLLERVTDQLFCRNASCEAQNSKRVASFTNKAKIKGFGDKTLEKLGVTSIPDLYEVTLSNLVEVMGLKMGEKLFTELETSKTMTLATFLSALSIPLIGRSASDKLVTVISSIEDINQESCKEAGLGEKATASLVNWIISEYPNYSEIPFSFTVEKPSTSIKLDANITVCCTGKIEGHTRNSLAELLNSLGVKVGSSVTGSTAYLICEELKGSSKEKKAEALGIEIISLTNFLNRK